MLVNTAFALKRDNFFLFANQCLYICVHSSNCKLQLNPCSLPYLSFSPALYTYSEIAKARGRITNK